MDQPVEAQQSCKCDKRGCRLGEEKKSQNDSCKPLEQKDPPNLGQVCIERCGSHCDQFLSETVRLRPMSGSSSPDVIFRQQTCRQNTGCDSSFSHLPMLGRPLKKLLNEGLDIPLLQKT